MSIPVADVMCDLKAWGVSDMDGGRGGRGKWTYSCHHAGATGVVEKFALLLIAVWWVDESVLELLVDEGNQLVAHFLLPWLGVVGFGSLAVGLGLAS